MITLKLSSYTTDEKKMLVQLLTDACKTLNDTTGVERLDLYKHLVYDLAQTTYFATSVMVESVIADDLKKSGVWAGDHND